MSFRFYVAVTIVLLAMSLGLAWFIAAPGPESGTPELVLVYVTPGHSVKAAIRFTQTSAADVEIVLDSDQPIGHARLLIAHDAQCRTDDPVAYGTLSKINDDTPQPKTKKSLPFGNFTWYRLDAPSSRSKLSCFLDRKASRTSFSTRRVELYGNPASIDLPSKLTRFDAPDCIVDGTVTLCPSYSYVWDLQELSRLDEVKFRGGHEVPGQPNQRELVAASAPQARADWVDTSAQQWHEFWLFVAAGIFGVGATTALEVVKRWPAKKAGASAPAGKRGGGAPP